MAALDTMPAITERVRNLLGHGRRITTARRYTYVDTPPEVKVGLTVGEIRTWAKTDSAGLSIHLSPGIEGFSIGAYGGEADTEREVWKRYHAAEGVSDEWFKRRRSQSGWVTRPVVPRRVSGYMPAATWASACRFAFNARRVCRHRSWLSDTRGS
jgi:hypothetical protein